jgi:hypothetical protein
VTMRFLTAQQRIELAMPGGSMLSKGKDGAP